MRDNVSDMLVRIKNGQQAKLFEINLFSPTSKNCLQILNILYKEGYIRGFKKVFIDKKLYIKVLLKYDLNGHSVIKKIIRVSKPGRRIYTSIKSLWKIKSGLGIFILSTPKGFLTDNDARILNTGGEIICYII